jgi:hypothetical protein
MITTYIQTTVKKPMRRTLTPEQHGLKDIHLIEKLKQMQEEDPDLKPIINWLNQSPDRPGREQIHDNSPVSRNLLLLWDQLKLVEGALFKQYVESGSNQVKLLLVVPKQLQSEIVYSAHNPVTSGHLGTKKTLSKIKRQFYWYKMKDTVYIMG